MCGWGLNGFQQIGDGLNQQSARFLAIIHQKAEIADIAGEQHIRLTATGSTVDGESLSGNPDGPSALALSDTLRKP